MQGVIAEYERAKILERSRRGRRHAARAGLLSAFTTAPFGYRCVFRRNQPPIPIETSHLFRSKPAGHSEDASRG
jgi:DNA invertase Pin-like site-specific DNA recombinase